MTGVTLSVLCLVLLSRFRRHSCFMASALESGVNTSVPSPAGTLRCASLHRGLQIGAYELLGKQGFNFF